MKTYLVIAGIIFLLTASCNKSGGKGCWQAFDIASQKDVNGVVFCNMTKAEAEAAEPRWRYYRKGEGKYCWKVIFNGSTHFEWGIPEEIAQEIMQSNGAYQYTKVNCSSFCFLVWIEKNKSKITGNYGFTHQIAEYLENSDSCSKLYIGRVIIYRETTDSLITRELSNKLP